MLKKWDVRGEIRGVQGARNETFSRLAHPFAARTGAAASPREGLQLCLLVQDGGDERQGGAAEEGRGRGRTRRGRAPSEAGRADSPQTSGAGDRGRDGRAGASRGETSWTHVLSGVEGREAKGSRGQRASEREQLAADDAAVEVRLSETGGL